jgi:alkylation response protein AidB-like acyl-CoA dehydrogenase
VVAASGLSSEWKRIVEQHRFTSGRPRNAALIDIAEDFIELREGVRNVCSNFPGAYWREMDCAQSYPQGFVDAMTDAGYLSVSIPKEYGGEGLPLRAAAVILEEVHASGCSASACHGQLYILPTLIRHWSDAQKAEYLPQVVRGKLRFQAFGVSEPTTGTDTTRMKTSAVREGDRFVISGHKLWSSRALQTDFMLLLARTTPLEEVRRRTEGLSVFLVDMQAALDQGMRIEPYEVMINHSANNVYLDGVRIPASHLIGEEGQGFRTILHSMNAERILIASEAVGDARWFIRQAVRYANERVVFDRPIGQNQGLQFPLARAYTQLVAADLAVRKAAALFDAGERCGTEANIAKLLASDAAWQAAESCMQVHGGFGFAREFDVERKWRETKLFQTVPISSNLILSHIAEHILDLPRSF